MPEATTDERGARAWLAADATSQSETGTLRRVLLKHVRDAFVSQADVDAQWEWLHFTARPDLARAERECDAFVQTLERLGATVEQLPPAGGEGGAVGLDAMYVHDASIPTDRGIILCSMGKDARRGEPALHGARYRALGIPILGAIEGDGRLEGGDVAWLDEATLAVARGYRTNAEGIRQLRALLGDGIHVEVIHAPHHKGPTDVFHLMSVLSPLDRDLALVYSPLMSVPFREFLLAREIELVEVPDEEFDSLGCNAVAVGPRRCLIVRGNPVTVSRLRRAGVEVHEFEGREICLKGCGGPTCLTRPLERARQP